MDARTFHLAQCSDSATELTFEASFTYAQKNAAELLGRRAALKTDFAITEQCNQYAECDAYVGVYGGRVFVIEYRDDAFAKGCRAFPQLMIVRRDLDLLPAGAKGHLYRHC